MFFVPLYFGSGVAIQRHADEVLRHCPIEQPVDDLPVAVGGLGGQAARSDLAVNEHLNIGCGNGFHVSGIDGHGAMPFVDAGLDGAFAGLGRRFAAGDLDGLTALTKGITQVVHVGLCALGSLVGSDVLDVAFDDDADGRSRGQRVFLAHGLLGFDLSEFFLGNLVMGGFQTDAALLAIDVNLSVIGLVAFLEACHDGFSLLAVEERETRSNFRGQASPYDVAQKSRGTIRGTNG